MKLKIFSKILFCCFAFLFSIGLYAQDPNFHIYLSFGQSNMEGNGVIEAQDQTVVDSRFQVMGAVNCTGAKSYTLGKWTTGTVPIVRCNTGLGPLDYFGRTMMANLPANIKVGVVPVAIGGCDIALFDKVNYGAYVATAPSWMIGTINQYGGNPYARLVEVAKLAQKDGVIKGILFHQGETNNGQQDWPNKVKVIYDNLIRDLGLDPAKTPFLAGELVTTAQGGACGGHNSIIAKLPNIIPNSYVISAAGLSHKGDNLHFTPASYRTLGQRYAQQMLTLPAYSNTQTMASNPVINADVPDISIIRVGNNYYMSSTTMHMNPGVPIMKSTDLVNWDIVNYCYTTLSSSDSYSLANGKNEYGHGSWASSIRYFKGMYYVTTFANTGRTYIYKTADIENGPWTVSTLNASYHDCNLFFDDDDRVYLIYGQGDIKIIELTADASAIKSGGVNKTLISNAGAVAGPIGLNAEGSQVLKYNGYYYINNICWPSGGMRTQIIHRSSSLTGTYDSKVILKDQGVAQGSFITTPDGKWYAYLFKDAGAVGRVPYLVPMTWTNNWPVLNAVPATLNIPKGTGGMHNIVASDEFSQPAPLKLAWQWNHNPQNNYWSLSQKSGYLRLTNERTDPNVLMTTNTLTQRTYGPQCSAYTAIDVSGMKDGDYVGMVALQKQYGYVGVKMTGTTKSIVMVNGDDVKGTPNQVFTVPLNQNIVYVRIDMDYRNRTDKAYFYYSLNGTTWQSVGSTLQMSYTIPHFMGYRYGLFTYATKSSGGYADFDFFRIGSNIAEASTVVDNNPVPVVSITSPGNNTVYTEGENVTINATATVTTGSISKVEFYAGTTLLGTDATSPYSYTITAATAGNYVITAKATSAANASATSTAVNIQVAKPIYQTGSAPVIDGTIDGLWNNIQSVSIAKNNTGTISSASDLSGNWKSVWDAANLYVLVQVTDDIKRNDGGTDVYNDDGVEIYMDMGNTKASAYGANDHQYTFRWNDATAAYEINGHSVAGITKSIMNTSTGYIVEVSIPWSTMGGSVTANSFQGFEVMLNDDDDGGAREGKLAWIATTDDTWSNPGLMGTIVLKGLNCTTPTAAITTTASTTFCAGGSVILNAPTGTGYSYVWKNGSTAIAGATAQTYTATTAGSYTVTVTNAGGCSATSTTTAVTVNVLPTISQYAQIDGGAWNQTNTATVCAGATIVLGPQPTITTGWAWTGPNGYASTTREIRLTSLTPAQGGVYTATYTDGNTCKASSTFTLTVNAQPTAAITATTPTTFCQGGSVVLTSSSGASYKWMNGTTQVGTSQTYTATTAGSYTVEVTNANTCKATSAAIAVTVNTTPTAAITTTTPTTFCAGGSVVLTASQGSSYKWMNGATQVGTAQAYTATTSGSYTVEVTNASGCKATSAATIVTVNAAPTATITANGPTAIPQGGSVVLTASAGSSYKWFNGTTQVGTAQTFTATTAGAYTVEVTNSSNCTATSTATDVIINTNQPSVITITSPSANTKVTGAIDIAVNVTDVDGNIVLVEFLDGNTIIGTSTTAPYVFIWDNPSEGSHTITVRVKDSNGGITTSAPVRVTSEAITTGVQYSNTLDARIYPNPSNGMVYVESDTDLSGSSFILVDVLGNEHQSSVRSTGIGAQIDVSTLSDGTYVLIIKKDNSVMRKKITVIR
jgi:beta-xylosidase